jgi:TolB-like protein/tetratricopeptide (TPR) repeat protein
MSNLFGEMKRRNVFRVAGMYAVVGWVLAQIATTLEETMGLPTWFDGLIVALLLIGFPIAIVFAWAFELTPQGVVRTEDVPEGASIAGDTGHKLDYVIVAGLILLAAMIVWQKSGEAPEVIEDAAVAVVDENVHAAIDVASIAVLPFADLSPGGDQEYFSDGISEEILNVLVGVDGLNVTSRTSSFQFKGGGLGIPEIAADLKVRHVVEGSVRKSGGTIRVTAQLIDATNDNHLWSDTFDRPLTTENIFEIQDEIARAIVTALSETLGVGELEPIEVAATTRNLDAYELYLQARPMFDARENLDVADDLLAEALEVDPEFARAWEMRAALQKLKMEYGYSDSPLAVAETKGREFAERALQLDPRSATALATIAKIDGDAAEELRRKPSLVKVFSDFDLALEVDQHNASALNWRGLRYLHVGYLDLALKDFRACVRIEPYYVPCVENQITVLGTMGRDADSLAAYIEALNTSTGNIDSANLPSLARLNMEVAFKTATNSSMMLAGWRKHDELYSAYKKPEKDHSDLIDSIRNFLDTKETRYYAIFDWLVNPIGTGWRIPEILVVWDPIMHAYRQSAEFKSYIRDSGVFEYWKQAGFPPQCRPLGDDDFECD